MLVASHKNFLKVNKINGIFYKICFRNQNSSYTWITLLSFSQLTLNLMAFALSASSKDCTRAVKVTSPNPDSTSAVPLDSGASSFSSDFR